MKKDDEIKKIVDEIFGKDDYTGLIVGSVVGISFIIIGILGSMIMS